MRNLAPKHCEQCKIEYTPNYFCSKKNWFKSRFCSWGCRAIFVTSSHVGSAHPRWRGGKATEKKRKVFYQQKRRVRKLGNGGFHTVGQWETLKSQYNWACLMCKTQEPKIKLTEDHIVPICKGGTDNIENIQPLCAKCNSTKGRKIIKF
jgi:hypothetical protein